MPVLSRAALVLVLSTVTPLAAAQSKAAARAPEVGQLAPPVGEMQWIDLGGAGASAPSLAALRGKVVVIADYGYYCDSCIRHGVPLLNALRASNSRDELEFVLLTAGIGEDTPALIRSEGEKLGLVGTVGLADVEGQTSPYLDMEANGNLTYAFVVGRHGGIVWKGDPSRKREEYVQAVTNALSAVPCAPLPETPLCAELAGPQRDYVLGDFLKAEAGAQALLKKLGTKAGAENDARRADAEKLLALVERTRKELLDELEKSGGERDAERFQRALLHVRRAFPKGPPADRASSLEMYVTIQNDGGPACKRWAEWYALAAARPATFPAEKDAAGQKYARELARYAKQADVPGLETVRGWLEAFAQAKERK